MTGVQTCALPISGPRPVGQVLFAVDGVPVGIATEVPFHVAYTPAGEGRHVVSATAYAGTASATAKAQVLVGATSTACRVP